MKEILERVFKNELDQWPHQYMRPCVMLIFLVPLLAGVIDGGIIGGLIFGAPFISLMIMQRFFPI